MSNICAINSCDNKNEWFRIANSMLTQAGIAINGSAPWDIQINNPLFFKRVLQQGSIGLGESYMDGWWDCDRLDMFIQRILLAKLDKKMPSSINDILRIALARLTNLQSKKRAWIVGKEHYDLGNDLFCHMLDPYMQYSCGYWKQAENLCDAQQAKLEMICRKLQLQPGMTLLDIGCGWGGLAAYAAEHFGVTVHGVTISAEQQALAAERYPALDIQILLQDYRSLNQQYDRIVSVGMFEHVGPKNYATYFKVVDRCLKSDGIFLLHTIGANQTSHNVDPWINKYIFPNGCLPSIKQIANASEKIFVMEDWHNFGADYDTTLLAWYEHFLTEWPRLSASYSARFKRMFAYYLNACAGAFRARDIQLWQVVFTRGLQHGLRVPH
ncbi:cyclopropane fatty acyl phospholipid synthase [Acerihabitans sp. TG2]|uniref:cyclopropane fatty acyl phospholipid synthase n=1 Tax=Acerihabitans sp. TG2 TaxID=3096008 RepID=UPI002B22B1A6|nr:cyclopropane fatty acyl phospholipid synthase [Acerihabitans sp. TG2]MEA9391589.1 cyclopropane fatty acyl phospholipid synthase [Acerihabitans sp. TG2]